MLHQVNKLQFEATCANEAQAFELRHNLSQTYQQRVADIIDKVCTQYVTEDEWIKLECIEIHLGHFTMQSYQNNFDSLLLEKFEKELCKKLAAIPQEEKRVSKQIAFLEMLLFFLQTGTLPWWADSDTVDMDTIFAAVLTEQKAQVYDFLQQHQFTAVIWQRIALQFNFTVQQQLIAIFGTLRHAESKIREWINYLSVQPDATVAATYTNDAAVQWHQFILANAPLFFSDSKEESIIKQLVQQFAIEYNRVVDNSVSSTVVAEKIMLYEQKQTEYRADGAMIDPLNSPPTTTETEETTETVPEEKFAIHTAGTVLLGPYFKQFFTHLNLLQQGEWKDSMSQYKAIHLIKYMATGQLMCAEHTLVLEKLLCGMDITAPLPKEIILSEEEKEEAALLLKAVIGNWEKLKNTSVDGLRETFLKRDGMLTKKENGWLLQVERKTVDVLLDSIPWSFATLAFSWNNYIIFTEW